MGHTPGGVPSASPGLLSMETLGQTMLMDAVESSIHPYYGRTVTLLDGGETFVCLVSRNGVVDTGALLGEAIAEKDTLSVRRSRVPARLLAKDCESQIPASIDGQRVDLVRREDSIASADVQFEVVKVL